MVLFAPELFNIQSSLVYITALSFTFAVTITCWVFIQQNGAEFVDWPKLIPYQAPYQTSQQEEGSVVNNGSNIPNQLEANVKNKASDFIQKWTNRRNSTAILNEAEQGYEMVAPFKKDT